MYLSNSKNVSIIQDAEEQYEEVLEMVVMFESDVKSLEQVITKARNVVSDTRSLSGPGNRRSFAADAWTTYDKVCICFF